MKKNLLLISILLVLKVGYSQIIIPDNSPIFVDNVLPRIDIIIENDSLVAIYDDVYSYHEYPATFIFDNGTIRDTVKNIGFRLRGNTSRGSDKKSFKVSFNTFEAGRDYYGLEKINLNGEHNDPTIMRSKVCWDILQEFHIPASRANHVKLYINGDYYGLYLNVEHIDEEFVKTRFGNKNGNLYKCLWPADLNYISKNADDYKFIHGGIQTYKLITNTEIDNYNDLANFIDILNNSTIDELPCKLETVFNVKDYLKIMAFDIITGNWDGYLYNKNNFYLYHNTKTNKLEFIPYDLDNTLGIDWMGVDWANRSIYNWAKSGEKLPLCQQLIKVQKYKDLLSFYINQLITEIIPKDKIFPQIDRLKALISDAVAEDSYYTMDYGFSFTDFNNSFDKPVNRHVTYGLKQYIAARINSAKNELILNDISPVVKYLEYYYSRYDQPILVKGFVENDNTTTDVAIKFKINNESYITTPMYDDGNHSDGIANDGMYGGYIPKIADNASIEFQIKAKDNGNESLVPCNPITFSIKKPINYQIRINEIMAGNTSTYSDEFGEFDDWVEIYNEGNNSIAFNNLYLTDNEANPEKWKLPDYTLQASEYILFWADKDTEQGDRHTNFKLNKDGEELILYEIFESVPVVVDKVCFSNLQSDFSLIRNIETNLWEVTMMPTPEQKNILEPLEIIKRMDEQTLKVFPNPAKTPYIYFNKNISFSLYDVNGRNVITQNSTNKLSVVDLRGSVYFLKTNEGEVVKIILNL